jgi:hypothetical protein
LGISQSPHSQSPSVQQVTTAAAGVCFTYWSRLQSMVIKGILMAPALLLVLH